MEVDGFTSTLTLQLYFDKSLKTAKIPAQDACNSARVRPHLLGIYCANNRKIYIFFYDETTGTMGPNEVSFLLDYLTQQLQNELGSHDHLIGPAYMSRAALVCRDNFQLGITWGEPARLMADTMNHGRPKRAWFWCQEIASWSIYYGQNF